MYYCELNSKRDGKHFLLHHIKCTCGLARAWYYFMACQSDHIKAYWEYKGDLIVRFNAHHGMTLEYPKGMKVIFDQKVRVRYPY